MLYYALNKLVTAKRISRTTVDIRIDCRCNLGSLLKSIHESISGFLIRCLMGAGWAWIAIRTGGIEFTTGAHLANNLLVSLFVAPVSFAPQPSHGVDYASIAVEGAIILLLVAVVEAHLRRKPADDSLGAGRELPLRR